MTTIKLSRLEVLEVLNRRIDEADRKADLIAAQPPGKLPAHVIENALAAPMRTRNEFNAYRSEQIGVEFADDARAVEVAP